MNGRQRYLCKDCSHRYTVAQRSNAGDGAVKRQALELYLEGFGFRSIGRTLGFSNVTILNWIRSFGEQLESIKNDSPVQVVEIDEMHSYVGSNKTIAGYGLLLIDMGKDSSVAYWAPGELQQGEKLWQALAPMEGEVMTDYWQPYESFVPAGQHTTRSQRPKPSPLRATTACSGISVPGCAASQNATANTKRCWNTP